MHAEAAPVGPLPEHLDQVPQSLREHFAETEVTVFGITARLDELEGMCPVPPEKRSPEAMEKFAAKILQASGIEIPEQFSYVLEPQHSKVEPINKVKNQKKDKPLESIKPSLREDTAAARSDARQTESVRVIEEKDELSIRVAESVAHDIELGVVPLMRLSEEPTRVIDIKARRTSNYLAPRKRGIKKPTAAPVATQAATPQKLKTPQLVETRPEAEVIPTPAKPHVLRVTEVPRSKPELRLAPKIGAEVESSVKLSEVTEIPHLTVLPDVKTVEASVPLEYLGSLEQSGLYDLPEIPPLPIEIQELTDMSEYQPARLPDIYPAENYPETAQVAMVEQIVEKTAVSNEVAEDAAIFLAVIPDQVQANLKEYIQSADPEAVEVVEVQIVTISKVADRLHELVVNNEGDSQEATRIEQWLTEQYTELLNTLGVGCDEETIAAFIELVKSENYNIDQILLATKEPYDPMRERHGWSDLRGRQTAVDLPRLLRDELVRFAVHHGLAATADSLAA